MYDLIDGEVVVNKEGSLIHWRGKPDGYPAMAIMPVPNSEDAVVLLDYMAGPKVFANLIRMTPEGRVVWRAAPPEQSGSDAFVECRWRGGAFMANSWSGYLLEIDLATGRPTSSEFVK